MQSSVMDTLAELRLLNPALFEQLEGASLPIRELAELQGFQRTVCAYLDGEHCRAADVRVEVCGTPYSSPTQLALDMTAHLIRRLLFFHSNARQPWFDSKWQVDQLKTRDHWASKREELIRTLKHAEELIGSGNEFLGGLAGVFSPWASVDVALDAEIARIRQTVETIPLELLFRNADEWTEMRVRHSAVGTKGGAANPRFSAGTLLDMFARDISVYIPESIEHRNAAVRDLINFAVCKRPVDREDYPGHLTNAGKVWQALDVLRRFPR